VKKVVFNHRWIVLSLITIALFGFFGFGLLATYCPVAINCDLLLLILISVAIALCYFLTHHAD